MKVTLESKRLSSGDIRYEVYVNKELWYTTMEYGKVHELEMRAEKEYTEWLESL